MSAPRRFAVTPGATVVYTYVVTNTGDTPLLSISVDDEAGHVGTIGSLAPGAATTRTFEIVLGSSPATTVGTASGTDALRMAVSDADDATVAIVAGTGRSGGSGSPFTGSDAGRLFGWLVALSVLGITLAALTRRRSPAADEASRHN